MRSSMAFVAAALLLSCTLWADTGTYQKTVRRNLDTFSAKVEALKQKSQKAGEATRLEIQKQTNVLDEKLAEARKKLNELSSTSADKSKPLRRSLDDVLHEIKTLYRKAAAHFK
jgi:septal ring factor EnvC (AmiA/AmiB activator)